MDEIADNPNIEWKNSGFDEQERLSRKVNVKEAENYNSKKKTAQKSYAPVAENLGIGLKKIRRKISKDGYDEEEDEDAQTVLVPDMSNSLMNALNEDEKKFIRQKDTLLQNKSMEDAGRMEAIVRADKLARETGMKGLDKKLADEKLQDPTLTGGEALQKIVKEEVVKTTELKWKKIPDGELIHLLRGVKNAKKVGGREAADGLNVKEVIDLGKESKLEGPAKDKDVAKKILKKTGRKQEKKVKQTIEKNIPQKSRDKELTQMLDPNHNTRTRS